MSLVAQLEKFYFGPCLIRSLWLGKADWMALSPNIEKVRNTGFDKIVRCCWEDVIVICMYPHLVTSATEILQLYHYNNRYQSWFFHSIFLLPYQYFQKTMPDKYEKDMNVLMKAAAEAKVSTKKLKRYIHWQLCRP